MATRFVDQGGSGTACSATSRCSMQTALSQAQPGDLISLASGTLASPKLYTGSASMLRPPVGKSGTASAPITAKAEVDGGVLIDGQFERFPIWLEGLSHFVVDGVNARNGKTVIVHLLNSSDVIIRRVVVWDVSIHLNAQPVIIQGNSNRNLFEDFAAFGVGRYIFNNYEGADNICRRCWTRWEGSIRDDPKHGLQMFYQPSSRRFLCENCLGTWWAGSMPQSYKLYQAATLGPTGGTQTNRKVVNRGGLLALGQRDAVADHRIVGSLAYTRPADFLTAQSDPGAHIYSRLASNVTVRHTMVFQANRTNAANEMAWFVGDQGGSGSVADKVTTVRVGPIVSGSGWTFTNHAQGSSISAVPSPFTNTGTSGANLCHRWVNGAVTTTPLWPWPMNARIKAATAMAGSYNGPGCGASEGACVGGRDARTETDVQADIEALLGPIPSACKAGSVGTLVLNVSPTTLTFNVTQGGPSDAKTVTVTNSGTGGPMPWSVTKSASLTMVALNPTSRADAGTFTATATAPSSLAAGQYTGTLTVSASGASGSPQVIGVTVNVAASPPPPAPTPTLALSPTSLTFDVVAGGSPVTKGVAVNNTTADSGPMSWSASANQSFVSLSPTSAPDVGTLNVTVNPAELAVGTRSAVVTVQANANNSPQTVGVTVNVAAAPVVAALALSQTAFTFRGQADATLPAQSLTIENSGDGGSIAWTASDNATWLGLSATSGVTPATIQLLVSTLGLAVGTHTATISVASASASNSPQTASVTLIVDPPPAEEEPTEPEVPPEDDPLPEPDPVPPEKPGKGHGRERAPGRLKKLIQSTTSALLVIVGAEGEFMHATLETDVGDEVDDG